MSIPKCLKNSCYYFKWLLNVFIWLNTDIVKVFKDRLIITLRRYDDFC